MTNEQLVKEIQKEINVRQNMEFLFVNNRKFIAFIIYKTLKRKDIPEDDMHDFIQGAYFALVKAVQGFNEDRGCKFLTYFELHIKNQLLRYDIKNSYTFRRYTSYDEPIGSLDESTATVLDVIVDDKATKTMEEIEDTDYALQLWDDVRTALPDQEMYDLIIKKYQQQLPNSELIKVFDEGLTYLTNLERRAKLRLQNNRLMRKYANGCWESYAYRQVGRMQYTATRTSSTEGAALLKLEQSRLKIEREHLKMSLEQNNYHEKQEVKD